MAPAFHFSTGRVADSKVVGYGQVARGERWLFCFEDVATCDLACNPTYNPANWTSVDYPKYK